MVKSMRNGVVGYLRNRLRAFIAAERGNVVMTFALATIPMIAFVGAAVDYSRGNSAKAAMQSALDATALILSKEAQKLNTDSLNQKADAIFRAQFHRPDVTSLVVTPSFTDSGTGNYKLTLSATGTVQTTFTRVVGQEQMHLSVSTDAVWGIKRLELALALDVTGSMASNNKMVELKKAAKALVTTLKGVAKKDGDVKIGIVPFAVVVNAGSANVSATSLDWSDWSSPPAVMASWPKAKAAHKNAWDRAGPGARCPFQSNSTISSPGFLCTNGPGSKANESTVTTIPTSGTYAGLICPSMDDGTQATVATGLLNNRYYSGCYYTPASAVKLEADWHPVATGSGASCGSVPSSQCQCNGSGSNKVCAFTPDSSWQSHAQGSSASCGNLSTSNPEVCKCFGSGSSKVCKQKTYDTTLRVWRPSPKTAWDGCVRDRNQSLDVDKTAPTFPFTNVSKTNISGVSEDYRSANTPDTSDGFQPFQYATCPATLMRLSFDWSAINTKIDELQPNGNTNVTIGLTWAFHMLTAGDPLNSAAVPTGDLDKVIILLTDGDNTQNRWTNTQTDIDARTQQTCANVKKANIKIYTIRVIDGNASLLQACASKSDMYYNVQDASQLNDVFAQIAKNLANLRIAK
jgi:Flp pilus assembly protein TadG